MRLTTGRSRCRAAGASGPSGWTGHLDGAACAAAEARLRRLQRDRARLVVVDLTHARGDGPVAELLDRAAVRADAGGWMPVAVGATRP